MYSLKCSKIYTKLNHYYEHIIEYLAAIRLTGFSGIKSTFTRIIAMPEIYILIKKQAAPKAKLLQFCFWGCLFYLNQADKIHLFFNEFESLIVAVLTNR